MEITSTPRIRIDVRLIGTEQFDIRVGAERLLVNHVWCANTLQGVDTLGLLWGDAVVYRKDGTVGVAKRSQVILHEHSLPTHVLTALRDGHVRAVASIAATVDRGQR